jgi:hypothetical protein
MALLLTTTSDGKHTEGIGAMAQYQIICYVLSKIYNVGFYFEGFKNLTHYQYFNITPSQWDKNINNFFNFPISPKLNLPIIDFEATNGDINSLINQDLILNIQPKYLSQFMDNYIDNTEVTSVLQEISKSINFDSELSYFNPHKNNIAIHIRRYTQTDCDQNPRREYFDNNKENYYILKIKELNNNNSEFHIYSQGQESDFEFLKQVGDNIILHIEENPLISLYHMINADVLFTANSSLSYIAHLLGNHKQCFVRDTFFHKWKNTTIKL